MKNKIDMTVKDLKNILEDLPDDMDVIIPVIAMDDANYIFAFRHVRTAGVLHNEYEEENALCLNASGDGLDISSQLERNDIECIKVLY